MIIKFSKASRQDLKDIHKYISDVLKNSKSAEDIVDGLLTQINMLESNPYLGVPVILENSKISSFYSVKYKNYLAFYRLTKECIQVDRILCGRRDLLSLLK